MGIAWNTRQLLSVEAGGEVPERTPVEYHLHSWRELYDNSILSADRHHSSAGEWVIHGDSHFYTVSVASRPVYALPQELCLAFDCFTLVEQGVTQVGSYTSLGPPIEEVARDFLALLSVWAREPLVPLGVRRQDNRAITGEPQYAAPPRVSRGYEPRPCGIDGPSFKLVLKGMSAAPEETVAAVLGAARFYHAALSQVGFDPSGAYVALVSAIECLAGHHYKKKTFAFEEVEKFKNVGGLLAEVAQCEATAVLRPRIEEELLRNEHFVWQKFRLFISEHIPEDFWETPDELYPHNSAFPAISREQFKWCLRKVYEARSEYVHGGKPFPVYADFGTRERYGHRVLIEVQKLIGQPRYLPLFCWFERITHLVIVAFMLRAFAPEVARMHADAADDKKSLLSAMAALPPNVQASLRTLTHWTARFVGTSVVNPHAPNREWADRAETVTALVESGLVMGEGSGLAGSSWLRNREVGEAAGEFAFGASANPLRGNEVLLPKDHETLITSPQPREGGQPPDEAGEE